ncbi:MAG: GNAT family protein [Thermoplasmata archaeon]
MARAARLGGRLRPVRLPLLTPRLLLRLPRLADVPVLVELLNDRGVFRPLFTRTRPMQRRDEVEFVAGAIGGAKQGTKLSLAVTLRESGALIGGIGLEIRDWENGHGWTGYWIARPYWHRAYGSEAVSEVCDTAFRVLKLHRIDASVFEFNARSAALLRRLGFRVEGGAREVARKGGRWVNEKAFGLLAREFRPFVLVPQGSTPRPVRSHGRGPGSRGETNG